MSQKLQPVRGTHDALPDQNRARRALLATATQLAERYGFGEISTPIFEFTEVFARTLGETSDIVSKEMYSLTDRGGESLTLRPEFTAGICRALMSCGLQQHLPLRLYAFGPLFRYERPQKGRLRQFHQFDVELLGIAEPYADIEVIAMGWRLLEALGLSQKITLEINSLGDRESRQAYRDALVAYFTPLKAKLSEESQARLERNPLRILDSKDEGDRALLGAAPRMEDFFTDHSRHFFTQVQEGLTALGIPFTVNPRLVRGMDYYCHSVFEFTTTELGAQGTVLAGGRYDHLVSMMGGPEIPAVGWATGIERLEALVAQEIPAPRPVVVAPVGESTRTAALTLADTLRRAGITATYEQANAVKKIFSRADKQNAVAVVLLGEDELKSGQATVKWLDRGEQEPIPLGEITARLVKL